MTLSPVSSVSPLVATSNVATTSSKTVCDLNTLQELLISKGIINQSGKVVLETATPPVFPAASQNRLDSLLDTPVKINSKKELKPLGEINLRRLLNDLGHDFEIVGSMVPYILGAEYLEALLAQHHITLSPALKAILSAHFKKGSDIDLRAKPLSNKPLGTFQGQLCSALKSQLHIDEYELSQSAFHKLHTMKGSASIVATLGEDEGHGIDFVIWEKPYRMHFATRDALSLQLSTRAISLPNASPLQSLLDHLFKIIRIDSPETVDHNGWSRLLSLRLKGHLPSSPELESILLQTLIKYEPYKNDVKFLVKLLDFAAKHHHKDDPEAIIKMAFLAAPVLLASISPQDFTEFWDKLTSKPGPFPPLAYAFASSKQDPKITLLLFRLALPFYESPYLQLTPLSPEELQAAFKERASLEKALPLLPEIPFSSLTDLLFERILLSQEPYALWALLKPYLKGEDLQKFESLLKEKVQGKKEREPSFLVDETLFVEFCHETKDDASFNLFFETLAKQALNTKTEAATSRSLFIQVIEIGRAHTSRLTSHDAYAEMVLLTLSVAREAVKVSYDLDFNKISSPQLRIETAATLVSHQKPFAYEITESDLEALSPTLENDARVRELFKEGHLKNVSSAFYFKWVKSLSEKVAVKSLRPWIYLFSDHLSKEAPIHKEMLQAFISAFIPELQDEGEAVIQLMDLAHIDSKPIKEKLAQALSEKKDKRSQTFFCELLPKVDAPALWKKAVEALSDGFFQETEDDVSFNQFFETVAQKALSNKKEAAKSRSLLAQIVEIGRKEASRLLSHNTYADMVLLTLSMTREGIKGSFNLDLNKISSPQKRIEAAATFASHRQPLVFNLPESDLEALPPTLENDAKVRELLKEGHLSNVSTSFYFKWVKSLMGSIPVRSLRPWIYLFAGLLSKEAAAHKEMIEGFISAFIPQMQDEGEALIKLLELAGIDAKPLKEKLAQALSAKKDKNSKELLWKLLPGVDSPELWKKAIESPSSAMVCILNQPLDFLPLELKTKLFKALLIQISEPTAKTTHLPALQALKMGLPPMIEWVRWLLTLKGASTLNPTGNALREFNPIPQKERGTWIAKLLELTPDNAQVVDPSHYELLNFPEMDPSLKVKGAFLLSNPEECRALLKNMGVISQKVIDNLVSLGVAVHALLTEIYLDEAFQDSIPQDKKNGVLLSHIQQLAQVELKTAGSQSLNQTITHILKLYSRLNINNERLIDEVTCINLIIPLLQKAVIQDRESLPVHLAELTYYISYHSTRRSFPGPHCLESLRNAVEDIYKNRRFLTLDSLVLPSIDSEASIDEKNQTLLMMFMVAEKLMYIPEMTLETRLFVRDYLMSLLADLAKQYPKHLILGVPCFDKLTYYIPPVEDAYWYNHWQKCLKLLNLFRQTSTDASFNLCYLSQKARLDPSLYVGDTVAQTWGLEALPLPDTYRRDNSEAIDLPYEVLLNEVQTLLCMDNAYACFRASQLFAYMPTQLFTSINLSYIMWELILKGSIPHLSETVNGFPLISHLVNAFFNNSFFSSPFCPKKPIDHVRHFFTNVMLGYEKSRNESSLFALFYILRSAITFKVHEENELDFLELIHTLIPFGDIWLKINVNERTFQPIFDLIAAMDLKKPTHQQKGLVVLASWIDIIHNKSPKLRFEVLTHIETCLKQDEYQNFFAKQFFLTNFIPGLKRPSP